MKKITLILILISAFAFSQTDKKQISEIKKFNPKEAKPPNYNPITDCGGFNCRHHWNWMSNSLAKAMGKDIDKFVKK